MKGAYFANHQSFYEYFKEGVTEPMTKAKKKSRTKLTGVRYENLGRPPKFINWQDYVIF
jgi:hypothetical protein